MSPRVYRGGYVMKFSEEAKKKYSCGTLLKKRSCNGRTIRIESLDVNAVVRINRRVRATAKQNLAERQQSEILAKDLFSD